MKKLFLIFILGAFFVQSCKKDSAPGSPIGGSSDLVTNKVGATMSASARIDGINLPNDGKATVISSKDGIIEMQGEVTVPAKYRELAAQVLPASKIDANGKLKITGKFSNTTEGIAYINKDGQQSVLAKYDCKVGDTWTYVTTGTNSATKGVTIERKVVAKSTTDDFAWGGMRIKVVTIEQTMPYKGVKKAVYRVNHKFGLVNVEVHLGDGTVVSSNIN